MLSVTPGNLIWPVGVKGYVPSLYCKANSRESIGPDPLAKLNGPLKATPPKSLQVTLNAGGARAGRWCFTTAASL
jgi:hypothetical protein